MASLKFLSLACASALLVAQANTRGATGLSTRSGNAQSPTYTVALGGSSACLTEINEAREAAGLPKFVEPSADDGSQKLPQADNGGTKPWEPVCKALITDETLGDTGEAFKAGTYAFMALSSADADCPAAVDHWKAALSNFTSIPPSKTQGSKLYENHQNVSFVAMYNPANDAAADCQVVTCTQKAASSGVGNNLRSDTADKTAYALLCMTTPDAFADKDKAPFTDDQWSKIKTSITGSASAVAPSLLAFVAVGLGLAAL